VQQLSPCAPKILHVSELTAHLRRTIESDAVLSDVWVQGEIANTSRYASGHLYFTLKDEAATMSCVMWKGQVARLRRLPREGEAVYAHGHVSVYDARGQVQLYVDAIEFLGAGALWQEFEQLKQRLANEGLFDESRKRPLPRFPRRIGIVTSRSGAVLQDIRHILERRYPLPQVFLASTAVQGADAPAQIVAALAAVQRVPNLDVIILARGGGSIEDLWAFNDERVARAICAARVPVVCGVGHETDFTIADFCADVRAPTPTAAAQFCTPDQNELRANLLLFERRLQRCIRDALREARRRLNQDAAALYRASPQALVQNRRQRVDELSRHAARLLQRRLEQQRARLGAADRQLYVLNPLETLGRGYAIVTRDETVITDPAQVARDDALQVRVRGGKFMTRVT